jgi:hypothetical protein
MSANTIWLIVSLFIVRKCTKILMQSVPANIDMDVIERDLLRVSYHMIGSCSDLQLPPAWRSVGRAWFACVAACRHEDYWNCALDMSFGCQLSYACNQDEKSDARSWNPLHNISTRVRWSNYLRHSKASRLFDLLLFFIIAHSNQWYSLLAHTVEHEGVPFIVWRSWKLSGKSLLRSLAGSWWKTTCFEKEPKQIKRCRITLKGDIKALGWHLSCLVIKHPL